MNTRGMLSTFTVAGLLIAATTGYPSQSAIGSDQLLDRRVNTGSIQNTTLSGALQSALLSTGTPGGMALTLDDGCRPVRYALTSADASLRGLLDAIVSADPSYKWEVADGVVNVLPYDGGSPFLATVVPKVEIHEAETPNQALNQLLAIPEVQRQARLQLGARLGQGGMFPFGGPTSAAPKDVRKISLSLANVSVREALNSIARQREGAFWVLMQGCGGKGRKIFSLNFFPIL